MEPWIQIILTLVTTLIASTGFWTYVTKQMNSKDVKTDMLKGLGHDRIVSLGSKYIERGWINVDEYENLYQYLYVPYNKMGGNGSAKRIMDEVAKLPIRKTDFINGVLQTKVNSRNEKSPANLRD